ncbi:Holliday junction branch migration protein RuvA [Candidatus Saccharibacteria bacterium]|nr:Holliday junction branch migration protein RuvA [Candidatus Saccharibacteria bacterium]
MIATLSGVISEKLLDTVVLSVNDGVGYGLLMTIEDYANLALGQKVKIYVYEHIRENAYDLFGFTSLDSKSMFEQLLSVNGVGPKSALSILSLGNTNDVRLAIAEGHIKYIQAASGVGKRVAERVVVDLKDKVGLAASDDATTFLQSPSAGSDEAMQALVALGYSPQDAGLALKNIDKSLPAEDRIKLALKGKS